ncbi:alpha/beta hydrolase [Rhodococcus sp. O3]|uniref:alpha/beta hydrolase n=1 Tax=Rhodococcus sp. O3 TaxID=3404919 RepID=UPI003B6759BD
MCLSGGQGRRKGTRAWSAFHPDLRLAALLAPRRAVTPRTLPVIRFLSKAIRGSGAQVVDLGDGVSVRVFRPAKVADRSPVLLWIHGGGYVIGCAAQDDALCRRYADRLGVTVVSVDYRLAPEHPYPIPLEDCVRALEWTVRQPETDPDRIVVGGASAGAGLAAALAIRARDRGLVTPVFQLLVYPMLDDRTVTGPENLRLWDPECNRFGWSSYLGGADPEEAVPARCTDLRGLPPAWIGVGGNDLFLQENRDYAERLADAGVPCALHVVDGAFHGFDLVSARSAVARIFFETQCTAVDAVLRPDYRWDSSVSDR